MSETGYPEMVGDVLAEYVNGLNQRIAELEAQLATAQPVHPVRPTGERLQSALRLAAYYTDPAPETPEWVKREHAEFGNLNVVVAMTVRQHADALSAQPVQPSDMPIVYLVDDDFVVHTNGNRVRLTRDQAKEVVAQLGEELEMDWYKDAQPAQPVQPSPLQRLEEWAGEYGDRRYTIERWEGTEGDTDDDTYSVHLTVLQGLGEDNDEYSQSASTLANARIAALEAQVAELQAHSAAAFVREVTQRMNRLDPQEYPEFYDVYELVAHKWGIDGKETGDE